MPRYTQMLAAALGLALAGCTVGPRYQRPNVAVPGQFSAHDPMSGGAQGASADAGDPEFWHSFRDPVLTSLVERALAANKSLRVAMARFDSANELLRRAKLDRYPTGAATEQGGGQRLPTSQAFGYPQDNVFSNTTANATWELDFYGRIRKEIEIQRQEALASANDLAAMQVTIAGEVATTYVHLRAQQEHLRIVRKNVESQKDTVRLVEASVSAGRGTQFDNARVRALLETTASLIPAFLMQIRLDEHRLAVLCGQNPDTLVSELDLPRPLFDLPGSIDPGTPGDLLRRRPDVSASEQRLHAATEQIGIATADLFPHVSLGGVVGMFQYHSGASFDGVSLGATIAPRIDWSFLDRRKVRARIAASRADGEGRLAEYQQTILVALEDVENALVRYSRSRERDARLQLAVAASTEAAGIAGIRYRNGATGLLDLLDAQRTQLAAEDTYAESHANTASAAVALYKALAGGWPQRLP